MRKFRYYFTLWLYPLGFLTVLGAIQYAILARAYDVQADRLRRPYVDAAPIPAVAIKVDRRPQSVDLP